MKSTIIAGLAAMSLAMAACSSGETAQPQWQLVEDLRIGGDEGGDMTMFTDIRGIVAGPGGNIFVLDARPQEIRVFDSAGRFVRLAARKGQGPGEIAGGNGLLLVRDSIWVNDPNNGRWSAWSAADGAYLRQVSVPINSYGYIWEAGLDADGNIVDPISLPGTRTDANGRPTSEARLRRVRTDGRIVDTLLFPACVQRNPPAKTTFTGSNPDGGRTGQVIPFLAAPMGVLDGKGGYWCSPNDDYVIVHRSIATGDTLHTIRMPFTRLPVGAEERNEAIEVARKSLSRYQTVDADYSLIPASHPVFARFDADDQGRLWARRTTAKGAPLHFDVYERDGKRIAEVTSSVPFNRYPGLRVLGDRVYGVVNDADDIPSVVRARIVRDAGRVQP